MGDIIFYLKCKHNVHVTLRQSSKLTHLQRKEFLVKVSRMTDLAEIREKGVILQVMSEWGPWSPCKQCRNNRGIKTSRGYCRLKRNINSASIVFVTLFFPL